MIARIWRGVTVEGDADAYYAYLRETGVKEYKSTDGNRGVYVLRRIQNGEAEFVLISLWESYNAIKKFAGEHYDEAVFYPEDDRYLVRKDLHVKHYAVIL